MPISIHEPQYSQTVAIGDEIIKVLDAYKSRHATGRFVAFPSVHSGIGVCLNWIPTRGYHLAIHARSLVASDDEADPVNLGLSAVLDSQRQL